MASEKIYTERDARDWSRAVTERDTEITRLNEALSRMATDSRAREAEKDATIKALADALKWAKEALVRGGGPQLGPKGRDSGLIESVDTALRAVRR